MDKNEILAKSREENKSADERELQTKCRAGNIAQSVGITLCMILLLVESLISQSCVVGMACLSIYFIMRATKNWVCFFILKDKKYVVSAIIETSFFFVALSSMCRGLMQ